MKLAQIRKALVAPVIAVVLAVVGLFGVEGAMTVKEAITLVTASGLTYLIPNEKE